MSHRLFQGQLNPMDKTHHRRTWEGATKLRLDTSWEEFPHLDGKLLVCTPGFSSPCHSVISSIGSSRQVCMGVPMSCFPISYYLLTFGKSSAFMFCSCHEGQEPSTRHSAAVACPCPATTTLAAFCLTQGEAAALPTVSKSCCCQPEL